MKPRSLFFAAGCLALAPAALAGTAAFLPGELSIVRFDHQGLRIFDPASGTEAAFEPPAPPARRALTASQSLLFVSSGGKVFAWSPQIRNWVEWWSAPEQAEVVDLAFDHKHDRLIVLAARADQPPDWWIVTEEDKVGRKVFNRRASGAVQPVFDASGSVFFTLRGDLWKGTIEHDDADAERLHWLNAQRLWPVALQETSDGTPGGSGACEIVPLRNHLILELSRYGGSGWGHIIRLPQVDPYEIPIPLQWQELEECARGSSAALSPDGKHAAVHINDLARWFAIDVATGDLKPFPH